MALLQEGQSIHGTYEIERFLGQGAFAEVYRVKHRFLGRQAMKVFKRIDVTLPEIEEMLGEAILLSKIGHPNIVRVFDANIFETPDGVCGYFTMENVSGGSLDKFWRSHGVAQVPVETTIDILIQVCRGLSVAHLSDPPIIHRDIKPQNILVGYESDGLRARVSDFGLAKQVNPLTLLATAMGTLAFKAPETFVESKSDSCAGDVWALGVTLYLLLTDQLPVKVEPEEGKQNLKAFQNAIPAPSSWNVRVDKSLDDIVSRCLDRDPARRYCNAKELLKDLEHWKESPKEVVKSDSVGHPSITVLTKLAPVDPADGERLVSLAISKAKTEGKLFEAADLMEEAFNKAPLLRQKYAERVRLWRCGISM